MYENKFRNLPEDISNRVNLIRNVVYHEVYREEF